MNLPLVTLVPRIAHLHGATLAQDQFKAAEPELERALSENLGFILDCSLAESVTASFVRGTLYRAFLCGQADVQGVTQKSGSEIRPLKLFPAVIHCNPEVADGIHEFFKGRNLPMMELLPGPDGKLTRGKILGAIDPILYRTLDDLIAVGEATAGELAQRRQEHISVNGWNNRLADLLLLRLVTRQRLGKFWVYTPLAKEIALWA